jgi:hypothetical protein
MRPDTARSIPSTPEATAAQAQSREGAWHQAQSGRTVPQTVPDRYGLGPGVTRASRIEPYRREPSDPVYRPLKIFTRDPAASLLEGSVALVNLPYEPLTPGPEGKLFRVEEDSAKSSVDLDHFSILLSSGLPPSVTDTRFHRQMVYAVCSSVYASFRAALGRNVAWGFDGARGAPPKLTIRPHAFEGRNAFYEKQDGTLNFGYYIGDKRQTIGNNLPGGRFYTCLSHDVVAHEVTHALLDGLRSEFTFPAGPDVLAFHEAFADLVALFQRFSYDGVLRAAIRKTGPKLQASALLTSIAEQFGETTERKTALRDAFDLDVSGQPKRRYDDDTEPHARGSVLVSAVFEAFTTVFERKVDPYTQLAQNNSVPLTERDLPSELIELLARSASRLASQFLSILIRAIDYCPPVDITFGDFLRSMITADRDLVPDDRYAFREAMIDAFRRRAIFPDNVDSLSEDSLTWRKPRMVIPDILQLNFANLKFRGDPQNASGPEELIRQAKALGNVICQPHLLNEFGLVSLDEARQRGIQVEPPCVQSIRSSRRIGPNGQVVFDLIGEVTQRQFVFNERRRMMFYGGSTIILGPEGEIRYVVSKSLVSRRRLDKQIGFISTDVGKGLWEETRVGFVQRPNVFRLLHDSI